MKLNNLLEKRKQMHKPKMRNKLYGSGDGSGSGYGYGYGDGSGSGYGYGDD